VSELTRRILFGVALPERMEVNSRRVLSMPFSIAARMSLVIC